MSVSEANQVSQTSYDKNHETYDKFRPGYTQKTVAKVIEVCKLTENSKVVEVAAGTGKFTNELVKATKAEITAVEPSTGMLESFRKNFPNIEAIQASSYKIPLPDASADAIIVAQGFHWFATHESLAEFARILKPGGVFCCVWNYEDFDALSEDNWQYRTVKLCHNYDKNVPQYNHMNWPKAFDNQSWFSPYDEAKFPYDKVIPSREFYWSLWGTRSYLTALSPEELEKVHNQFEKIMDESLSKDEIQPDGSFVAKRGGHVIWATRN